MVVWFLGDLLFVIVAQSSTILLLLHQLCRYVYTSVYFIYIYHIFPFFVPFSYIIVYYSTINVYRWNGIHWFSMDKMVEWFLCDLLFVIVAQVLAIIIVITSVGSIHLLYIIYFLFIYFYLISFIYFIYLVINIFIYLLSLAGT